MRILVVDDDANTRKILAKLLASEKYDVDTCEDGEHALARLRTDAYDVLLTDLVMPKMDGLKLVRAALELDEQLHCFIVTGHHPSKYAPQRVTWVSKPIDIDRLVEQISSFDSACARAPA